MTTATSMGMSTTTATTMAMATATTTGRQARHGPRPVCGMTINIATATAKDLVTEHDGKTYYFCGKGCYLEFGDDPAKYLDPTYVPSM